MCLATRLRDNIQAWRNISAPDLVLRWISEGVPLPFVEDSSPISYHQVNPVFSDRHKEFLRSEIRRLVQCGAVQEVSERPLCVSPIKCVPKKNGKLRLITDLRILNGSIDAPKFRYENIDNIAQTVSAGDYLVTIDLKDGFFHIPVLPDHRTYLGFSFGLKYYQWCVCPFGLSCSPYYFCKVLRPVLAFIRTQGIDASCFVDDWIVSAIQALITDHSDFVIHTLTDLGFLINFEKSCTDPAQRALHLGYIIDTLGPEGQPWIYIGKDKLKKLKKDIRRCLLQGSVHARVLAKIAGQAVAMSKAILPGKLKLRSLYTTLGTRLSWTDRLQIPAESQVHSDLIWWLEAVDTWNGSPLKKKPIDSSIWTDASDFGWGCTSENLEAAGVWDAYIVQKHINFKELTTVLIALQCFREPLTGKHVQVYTDSGTTVAYVNNLGGPSCELSDIAERIWALAYEMGVTLTARHLPGVENVEADRLSRLSTQYEWKLNPRFFRQINRMWGPHSIDRFASIVTSQLPVYNSRYLDPQTSGIDALAQHDWGQNNNYVNPPFRMLDQVLDVIIAQQAYATVIAPLWRGQAWFAKLRRLLVAAPLRLPNTKTTMWKMGNVTAEPLKNPRWAIYAWRIFGGNN